jgi:hypothetical protein
MYEYLIFFSYSLLPQYKFFEFFLVKRKSTNSNVLKQIKHQYERRNVLSTDIFIDAQATKLLCEAIALPSNSNCLKGFVQLIIQDPFGMLFFSDIQVISFKQFIPLS